MAKVSRSLLKSIVKECLVEILAEGLSESGNVEDLNESIVSHKPQKRKTTLKHVETSSSTKVTNPKFEESANRAISQATSDPIMASILADTAKTTLQEQNVADSPNKFTAKPTDSYSKIADESDPMELFSESASNWANLAFSDK